MIWILKREREKESNKQRLGVIHHYGLAQVTPRKRLIVLGTESQKLQGKIRKRLFLQYREVGRVDPGYRCGSGI